MKINKVSVIIPVYNTEEYLGQCIDSVMQQSYRDLEILLIDDGSTDSSPIVCDRYEQCDLRIKVVHKQNGGLSSARNKGIEHATGKYVMFLDSDDYWDDKYLVEDLLKVSEDNDLVNFRYKFYMEETRKYIDCLPSCEEDFTGKEKEEILEVLLQKGLFLASACNKLILTSVLKENNLYFREKITSEDVDWCARLLLTCNKITYLNKDSYVYRQRQGSITHTIKYENVKQLAENVKYCATLGKDIEKESRMYKIYYTYVAYQYGVFLVSNHYGKDERIKEVCKEMREYCWLLQYYSNRKIKALYQLNRYLGYNGLNFVMWLYSKVR